MYERVANLVWRMFGRRDSGQDLLEYALLVALIALAAVSAVTGVGNTIRTVFWDVIDVSTNAL